MTKANKIAVVQHKGGVGKTTSLVNLAGAIHDRQPKAKIAIFETDGQGNATASFGLVANDYEDSAYDVLINDTEPSELMVKAYDNIDLLPANDDMSFVELDLQNKARNKQLESFYGLLEHYKKHSEELQDLTWDGYVKEMTSKDDSIDNYFNLFRGKLDKLEAKYDYILFDTAPALESVTSSVLSIADSVLLPYEPDTYTAGELPSMISRILTLKEQYNPEMKIAGVFATKLRHNIGFYKNTIATVKDYCKQNGIHYLRTTIPNSVRFPEDIGDEGLPATLVEPKNKYVVTYLDLYDELRENKIL